MLRSKLTLNILPKVFNSSNNNTVRISLKLARPFSTTGLQFGDVEKNVVRSKFPDITAIKDMTVTDFIRAQNGTWMKDVAYECSVTGLKFTYEEVLTYSKNFGAALLKSGLNRGDIMIMLLPNCPQFPVVLQAALQTGIVASPISPALTPGEIKALVAQTNAKAIVTIPEFLPLVKGLQADPAGASIKDVISVGPPQEGLTSFFELIKTDPTGVEFLDATKIDTKTEPALILWSSGTTGLPKGVVLSHGNLIAQVQQITQEGVTEFKRGQETALGLVPFFHVLGAVVLCNVSLHSGVKIVTLPKFDPALFTKAFKQHKFSITHLVPPLLGFLVANPALVKEDFQNLHKIVCGGAQTPPHVIQAVLKKADRYVFYQEAYGMTETTGATHCLTPASKNGRLSSIGPPLPSTDCKIVDVETGEALGPNQNGEICIRGPQVMQGYLHNQEATRQIIDKDGWLHTGDIGYYSEEEYFYVVDRLKELIKVKGLQVSPSEVEATLGKFPKVADVAVIGIPDERAGELPRAYVVRKDPSLTEAEIHEFLQDKVAEHKQLKGGIQFLDAIPKAPSGKILRKDLRALYNSR